MDGSDFYTKGVLKMTEMEIVAAVRSVAAELSCRGSTPGQIGAGTRHRICTLFNEPKPLIAWFNRELETTASGQRLPTAIGEIVKAIITHLTATLGAKCKTASDQEQAIVQAAIKLPGLCDRLEIKPSKQKQARRRRRLPKAGDPSPLTPKQTEAVLFVSECEGNVAAAAKRAGIDRKSMQDRYDGAMAKIGKTGVAKHRTKQMVRDMRGQENVTKEDDRRGQLRG